MLTLKVVSVDAITYDIQLIRNGEVVWSWKVNGGFLDEDVARVITLSDFLTKIPSSGHDDTRPVMTYGTA
jgi:hypothetical protein